MGCCCSGGCGLVGCFCRCNCPGMCRSQIYYSSDPELLRRYPQQQFVLFATPKMCYSCKEYQNTEPHICISIDPHLKYLGY